MENCAFLEGKVDDVSLLLFEFEACLAYDRHDLPEELASLDLGYHVHLPLDLPWPRGGKAVAGICLALLEKLRFLGVTRAVLHPPPVLPGGGDAACRAALTAFAGAWRDAGRSLADVFLENTRENDLIRLEDFFHPGAGATGSADAFGLCPDLGHILAYGQTGLLELLRNLPESARPRMVHCNAPGLPGSESGHQPMDTLDAEGFAVGRELCSLLGPSPVIVAELFDWGHILRSIPVLERWLETARPGT